MLSLTFHGLETHYQTMENHRPISFHDPLGRVESQFIPISLHSTPRFQDFPFFFCCIVCMWSSPAVISTSLGPLVPCFSRCCFKILVPTQVAPACLRSPRVIARGFGGSMKSLTGAVLVHSPYPTIPPFTDSNVHSVFECPILPHR